MKFIHKLLHWYFSKDALPYWCILTVDCAILLFFFFFGYYCVLGGNGVVNYFWPKFFSLSVCMVFFLIGFKTFHTYSNIVRYSSFIDLYNVALANLVGSACVLLVRIIFFEQDNVIFPGLRVTLFAFCFGTLAMWGWRVLVKTLFDIGNLNGNTKYIYIYGTKSGGVGLAKSLRNQRPAKYMLKGFVSPDKEIQYRFLMGVPVFPSDIRLVPRMLDNNIKALMVSPLITEEFRNNQRLISDLTDAGIKIYMMPEAQEWDGTSEIDHRQMLHRVEIEDLLPREQIDIDMEAVGNLLRDQSILITGAAGSIGNEMVKQIATFHPKKMILIDQAETPMHNTRLMMAQSFPNVECSTIVTSITNKTRMERIFSKHHPDYVFHAAAYKHVPMMEDNPAEAVMNNVYGTRVIADLAVKYNTKKFVMISTDKAVNPTNVMGCSKRICEIYTQSLNAAIKAGEVKGTTQFVTTRFGNVLGSNGSVIPIFREQIRNGGPITVTHPDIIRFFMLISEACKLVLQAGTFGNGGEIFVFDMGKPVRIADLAKRMIALSNAKDIEIKYTGLREGEKLFEEVLSEAEKTLPTAHPKIHVAMVREYPYKEALRNEERLCEVCKTYDNMEIVKVMKEIVPEYISNNSVYSQLDKI